jgi:hypothetical protein
VLGISKLKAGRGCVPHELIIQVTVTKIRWSEVPEQLECTTDLGFAARLHNNHRASRYDGASELPGGPFFRKQLQKVLYELCRDRFIRQHRCLTELFAGGEVSAIRWKTFLYKLCANSDRLIVIDKDGGDDGAHDELPNWKLMCRRPKLGIAVGSFHMPGISRRRRFATAHFLVKCGISTLGLLRAASSSGFRFI